MAKADKVVTATEAAEMDTSAEESLNLDDVFGDEEESTESSNSYGLESLDFDLDNDKLESIQSVLALETGTYKWKADTTNENPTVTISFSENDFDPKDIKAKEGKGRCFINLFGQVVNTKTKKEGRFNFGMSPDSRTMDNGDTDPMTKTYARFSAYYFNLTEEKAKNPSKVVALAASTKHVMYITKSKSGDTNYLNKVQKPDKE